MSRTHHHSFQYDGRKEESRQCSSITQFSNWIALRSLTVRFLICRFNSKDIDLGRAVRIAKIKSCSVWWNNKYSNWFWWNNKYSVWCEVGCATIRNIMDVNRRRPRGKDKDYMNSESIDDHHQIKKGRKLSVIKWSEGRLDKKRELTNEIITTPISSLLTSTRHCCCIWSGSPVKGLNSHMSKYNTWTLNTETEKYSERRQKTIDLICMSSGSGHNSRFMQPNIELVEPSMNCGPNGKHTEIIK